MPFDIALRNPGGFNVQLVSPATDRYLHMLNGYWVLSALGLADADPVSMNLGRYRFTTGVQDPILVADGILEGVYYGVEPYLDNFGRLTTGGDTAPLSDNRSTVDRITIPHDGSLESISAFFATGTAAGNWKGVVYADNGSNLPGALLYVSDAQASSAGLDTAIFSEPPAITAGDYWVGIITSGTYTAVHQDLSTGVAPNTQIWNGNNYATPTAWGTSTTSYDSELCVYATVLVGGEGYVAPPAAPVNLSAPVNSGADVYVGTTRSCTTGSWSGNPTPTYSYQWRNAGVDIGGATSSTYVLQAGDIGDSILCRVTATNTEGVVTHDSNAITAEDVPSGTVFGDNTLPAGGFPGSGDRALVSSYVKSGSGTITSIFAHFRADTVAGASAKVFFLTDSAGAPGSLIVATTSVAVPSGGGWVEFPVPGGISGLNSAGTYWMGVVNNSFEANPGKHDTGSTGDTRMANGTFSFASPPGTWPGTDGNYVGKMGIYCFY